MRSIANGWASDVKYIPVAHGFVYLTVIMDGYSRKVLAWQLSNSPDVGFCVDAEAVIRKYIKYQEAEDRRIDQYTLDIVNNRFERFTIKAPGFAGGYLLVSLSYR